MVVEVSENRSLRVNLSVNATDYISGVRKASEATKGLAREALGVRTNLATIVPEVARINTALRGLNVPPNLVRDIRLIGTTISGQINNAHALNAALAALRLPQGGLAGADVMRRQIQDLEDQIRRMRTTAGAPIPLGPTPHNPTPSGGSGGSPAGASLLGASRSVTQLASMAAGYLAVGSAVKSTLGVTADFETNIATFGVVANTSGAGLTAMADQARALGKDASIAGASASDAATAMVELAKGGLSASESMAAAKGTLQLASAASVDAATAAQIQSTALNAFSLKGKDAAAVADLLANTANSASGEITDFALGLSQSAAVTHQLGSSLDDTLTMLGLFAKAGLKGSDAGTSLKTMYTSLLGPTKQQQQAQDDLNLTIFDANHKFVGARELTDQLSKAKARMTQQDFITAASTAFGTDAVRAAGIAADAGAPKFDNFRSGIEATGGAAKMSEAKMSGLGGAFAKVQNAAQDAEIAIGEKFSPILQTALGHVTDFIAGATDALTTGGGGLAGKVVTFFKPLVDGAASLITTAWPYVQKFGTALGTVWSNIIADLKPLADGIGNFFKGFSQSGVIDVAGKAFIGIETAVGNVYKWLQPVAEVVGSVVGALGHLPGPIYAGTAALGAFLLLRGPLSAMLVQAIAGYARLGTALMGMTGAGILSGLRGLGAGLLSAFGGPLGLVIAGVTTALGFWIKGNQDAKAAADATKQSIAELGTTADQVTGSLTAASAVKINKDWINSGVADQFKGIGAGAGEAAASIVAGGAAVDAYRTKILAAAGGFESFKSKLGTKDLDAWSQASDNAGVSTDVLIAATLRGGDGLTVLAQKIAAANKNSADPTLRNVDAIKTRLGGLAGNLDPVITGLKSYNDEAAIASKTTTNVAAAFKDATTNVAILTKVDPTKLIKGLQAAAVSGASVEDTLTAMGVPAGKAAQIIGSLGDSVVSGANGFHYMSAEMASSATVLGEVNATWNSLPDFLLNAQDIDKAGRITAASFTTVGGAAIKAAADTSGFFATVSDKSGDPMFVTRLSTAFDKYTTAVSDADTTTQLFVFTMDKLAGRNVSVEDAMSANAAAARGIGKAFRDSAANAQAYADAQAKLKDDKGHLNDGTDKATNAAQIAADERAVADAYDATKASVDGVTSSFAQYQKTAALRVTQVANDTNAAKGFGAAVAASRTEMQKQRDAFIAQQPAADIASGAAAKLADKYGLIPGNIVTILTADPKLAMAAYADAQKTLGKYAGQIDKMPKDVKTLFNAEVAVAEKNGTRLYRVYNQTTGKWEATFEAPNAAATQLKAGKLVQQYDKANGTWTASLIAEDRASAPIMDVQAALNGVKDKTVTLTVNSVGQGVPAAAAGSTAANPLFRSGSGALLRASGGRISGPGTGTSDSIPAYLSNGEYVINAKATAKHLPLLEAVNAQRLATGGIVGKLGNLGVNMLETGPGAGPAVSAVTALYGRADAAAAATKKAADAAAAAAAAIPKANSGGTEQWRALAMQVAAAHGENLASVQVMLNQMSRESGGNPAAINLTDLNAQAGHPSVGLLQFIPGTFAANADPGYSSNIYDPESQMRAWYNYINRQYGGYQSFGARGYGAYANGGLVRGAGTGRSDSIPARVSNGEYIVNAAATSKHLPLLSAINHYADGGLVGSLTALSGRTAASAGPELSQVVQALQDIAAAVQSARDAARDKSDLAVSARDRAGEAGNALTESIKAKASAATIANNRVRKAAADLEYRQALRTFDSYRRAAGAADAFQKAQQRSYRTQQAYAARVDQLSTSLATASDKLAGLRSSRADMMSGISGTVSGFDGGITGHNDTRTSFATILKGQQYDAAQAQAFNVNIVKLRKLGLSNGSLNSIASAGVDGGGVTAAALAKASPAQIKQLNDLATRMHRIGDNVGNVVAGQFYDAGIAAGTGLVKGLQSQIGAIQKVMNAVATSVVTTLTSKLQIHSPSRVMHGHGVNIVEGLNNGILSSSGKVASSMAGLVQAPNIPAQSYARAAAGPQAIDVQVFLDGQRIDDRIDVKINGNMVQLAHSFEKASMQSR